MGSSKLARSILGLNAAFSLASGLLLSIFAGYAARALFEFTAPPTTTVRVTGVFLVLFAGAVAFAAARRTLAPPDVRGIAIADLAWVVGSAVLLAGFPHLLTGLGVVAVSVVASAVGAFAIGQFIGAARMERPDGGKLGHLGAPQARGRRND